MHLLIKKPQLDKEYIYFTFTRDGVLEAGHFRGALKARLLAMPIDTPMASMLNLSSRRPFTFARSRDQMASSIAIQDAKLNQKSSRNAGAAAKAKSLDTRSEGHLEIGRQDPRRLWR